MSIGIDSIRFFNLSSSPINKRFFDFLVALLKENDINAIVETHDVREKRLKEILGVLHGGRAALLDLATSEELVSKFPGLPTEVKTLECADSMFFTDGRWWPRLTMKEAVRSLIIKKARTLDIMGSAYIIGEGPCLRVFASLAVSLGYSKIFLVGNSKTDIIEQRDRLSKNFVGIDWRPLEASLLTMQTVGATLLINSMALSDNPVVMQDLAYFNYMKGQGLVVDLEVSPADGSLLDEAQRAGLRMLNGVEVRCHYEYAMLERLGFSQLISFEKFHQRWQQVLPDPQ